MNNSAVFIAYEINAQIAKSFLQKRSGLAAKFKKFQVASTAGGYIDNV